MTSVTELTQSIRRIRVLAIQNGLPDVETLRQEGPPPKADERSCKWCGLKFETRAELNLHQWENLYEGHVRRYRGKYVCSLCGSPFDNMKQFENHWQNSSWHENFAAGEWLHKKQTTQQEQIQWLCQPWDRKRLTRRLREDPKLKACLWGEGAGDITLEQIDYVIRYYSMLVSETTGSSEVGKSTFIFSMIYNVMIPRSRRKIAEDWLQNEEHYAAAVVHRDELTALGNEIDLIGATIDLMKHIEIEETELCGEHCRPGCQCGHWLWREPRVYISWSIAETLEILKTKARPHDHIVQDENQPVVGTGSRTLIDKINSTLQQFRARRINFHFISPNPHSYLSNVNMRFEITHKRFPLDHRISRGMAKDADDVALGWAQLPVLGDKHIVIFTSKDELVVYKEEKDRHLLVAQERQSVDTFKRSDREFEADAEKVVQILFDLKGKVKARGMSKEQVTQRLFLYDLPDHGKYQEAVCDEAHSLLTEDKKKDEDADDKAGEENLIDKEGPTIEGISFDPLDYLDLIEHEWENDPKRAKHDMAKYVRGYRWFLEESEKRPKAPKRKEVAEWCGLKSGGGISDRFKEIDGYIAFLQGEQLEKEMYSLYCQSDAVEVMKPNSPDPQPKGTPDRIVYLKDGTARICSWKCVPSNPTIPIQGPEMDKAREMLEKGAKNVVLMLEGLCEHGFFSIELNPYSTKKHRTIMPQECQDWPPKIDEIL